MRRGVEEGSTRHVESILERRVAFRVLLAQIQEGRDVVARIARHGTDSHCETVCHTNYAKLRYGILLEVFTNELLGVANCEKVARGSEIFFQHCKG